MRVRTIKAGDLSAGDALVEPVGRHWEARKICEIKWDGDRAFARVRVGEAIEARQFAAADKVTVRA